MEDAEKLLRLAEAIKALRNDLKTVKEKAREITKAPGPKGDKGDRGLPGKDGLDGRDGRDGRDGLDGKDGRDGVSVVDAEIDFDNSLVIRLSDGTEIDAGQINFELPSEAYTTLIQQGSGSGTGEAGPPGPPGPPGDGTVLGGYPVSLTGVAAGDSIQFTASNTWVNTNLADGGNF